MADAKIRLRLDAKDAKRELADLRADFRATADEAGGMSAGFNSGGGGGGGMGVGRIAAIGAAGLGAFAFARGTLGGIRDIGQAATEGPSAIFQELALGTAGANARGSLQALQSLKDQAGMAVGFGASPESFRGLFEAQRDIEQRTERGQLALTSLYGGDVAKEQASEIVQAIKDLPGRIASAIRGVFGGA